MLGRAAAVLVVVVLGVAYRSIQTPPPRICGSPNGPPITSPRIQLNDGRHLAYKEYGAPKNRANYKVVVVHGFGATKDFTLPASQGLVDELGIYFLSFDRAGYGESDPNPKRSVKSEALDIQQLTDQLKIGHKFYIIGESMGGYPTWSCINYIPHRLAGAALVVPITNYWWPSFPAELSAQVYKKMLVQDQRTLWIAHHAPSLLYGWMTQKWLPTLALVESLPSVLTQQDMEILEKLVLHYNSTGSENKAWQQGVFESLHRDLMVGFGNWDFDPMNLSNPFQHNEGSVHIWQGYEDRLVPVQLQRYVAEKLPWIRYHENPEGGHMFFHVGDWYDVILKSLLLGQ